MKSIRTSFRTALSWTVLTMLCMAGALLIPSFAHAAPGNAHILIPLIGIGLMAGKTGTHDISTLLAARFASAARYGLNTINEILAADLGVHNRIVEQMMAEIADITTDRQRIYGTSDSGQMSEVDEYGRAPTQKPIVGATAGFPLKLFQYSLGWTRKWLQTHSPYDMAIAVQGAEKAHLKKIQAEIKRAIYLSANYTWQDTLVDNIVLNVKRFLNADGSGIPEGPNGEVYVPGTHTHYLASATWTAAALTALINTVVEHGNGGEVRVYINQGDETTVRAIAGFQPYLDPRVSINLNANQPDQERLDITRLDNRPIGIYGAAEVWCKPWALVGYAFAFDVTSTNKPLVKRVRDNGTGGHDGLRIAAELDTYPLHAQFMEAEFGVGTWTRTNGAVSIMTNGSYTDPVIAG